MVNDYKDCLWLNNDSGHLSKFVREKKTNISENKRKDDLGPKRTTTWCIIIVVDQEAAITTKRLWWRQIFYLFHNGIPLGPNVAAHWVPDQQHKA